MRRTLLTSISAVAALALAPAAQAAVDQPLPGVTLVRTGPHALAIADLCSPGVSVRATKFDERRATAQGWATKPGVNADVAVNGDFFDFSASGYTYVVGRARGAGQDWPNQNREARPFWQFGPKIAEMMNAGGNPAKDASEVMGGHNVIIRDGRSLAPAFDGDSVILTAHRRTGIGLSASRTRLYLFASDASLDGAAMANAMFALAAEGGAPYIDVATNQDGGGSSQLYVRGRGDVIDSTRLVNNHLGILAKGTGASPQCLDRTPTQKVLALPTACGGIDLDHGLDRVHAVSSCDGRYSLVQQDDGNLVLYSPNGKATWSTNTGGRDGGYSLQVQPDGNVVLYSAWGLPVFASNTGGHAGARLALQDDGNLVVYEGATALWSTQTSGKPEGAPPAGAPTTAAPTKPAATCGRIVAGEGLGREQSFASCDGRFTLTVEKRGNVTLRESDDRVIWQAETTAALGYALRLDAQGDLQIQSPYSNLVWSARTGGHPGAYATLQDDGNLVVYGADDKPLWASNSVDNDAPPPKPQAGPGGNGTPGSGATGSSGSGSADAADDANGGSGGCRTAGGPGGAVPGTFVLAGLAAAVLGVHRHRRRR